MHCMPAALPTCAPPCPPPLPSHHAVVWGLLADLVLFNHAPSPLSMAGAALVCASSFLIVCLEQRGSSSREGGGPAWAPLRAKHSDALEGPAGAAPLWPQRASLEGGGERHLEMAEGGTPDEMSRPDLPSRAGEHVPLVASRVQRAA